MTYENFVQAQLAAPLGSSDTTLTLANPIGAYRLPPATGGILVLADSVGSPAFTEIVSYVSRSGNTLSGLTRGQEGTSARAWPAGTFCYQSLTAGDFANALGLKAPLASPAFTGNPTAPTPATTDTDTSIATTAFVRSAMGLFGIGSSAFGLDTPDLNEARPTGFYYCSTPTNGPGENGWLLHENIASAGYATQTYKFAFSARVFSRTQTAGTWSAWQELWHTGNLVKQTSSTDTTAGALMAVGAFGLGADAMPPRDDLNTLTTAGIYQFNIPTSGSPGFDYGAVLVLARATNEVVQIAWDIVAETQVSRKLIGDTWSPWRAAYHTGNILGTVSQSGGVPTGAIIERGSNANGEYVRFADGTQECWLVVEETLAVINAYGASRYGSRGWIFPAGFSAQPEIAASARTTANLLAAVPLDLPGYGSNTSCNWAFLDVAGASHTGPARMTFSAKGRWY